jgi:tetratricopeptide (TPR) repeat protein
MKRFDFGRQLIFRSALLFLMASLLFTSVSFAQPQKEEWNRAVQLFNEGQQDFNRSDFRGTIAKWEEALSVFRKFGNKKAMTATLGNLGNAYVASENYRKAISFYEEALAIAEQIGDKEGRGGHLGNLGIAYNFSGDYRKAIFYHEQALAIAAETGSREGMAKYLGFLGSAYSGLGDHRKAISCYEQGLAIAEQIGDKESVARYLGSLGLAHRDIKDFRKAISYYEQALTVSAQIGDKKSVQEYLEFQGSAYRDLGEYRKAASYYEQAAAVAEQIGDKQGMGILLNRLGVAYRYLGEYQKAISYHEQALAIAEQVGDKQDKANALGSLGTAINILGDHRKAIAYYEQALAIAEETGNKKGKENDLGNLGITYDQLGDHRKAISYYEQALAIAEEIGDRHGKANAFGNMGNAYRDLGDFRKAISCYEQALTIVEQIRDKHGKGIWLGSLGNAYFQLGDSRMAASYYEQALTIAKEIEDKQNRAIWLGNLGNVYSYSGDHQKSISYYEQAIAVEKELGVPYDTFEGNLGDAYLALDRDEEALVIYNKQNHRVRLGRYYLKKKEYRQAIEQFEQGRERDEKRKRAEMIVPRWIGLGLSHEGLREYGKAYEWYTKAINFMEDQRSVLTAAEREHYFEGMEMHIPRIEAYEGAARCAFLLGRLEDAFYWSENTRGRVLSELLTRRHAGQSYKIPLKLAQEEEELTTQIAINKKQQQTAFQKENAELLKQAEGEYPILKKKLDDLIDRLRREYPQYAAIKYPQPVKLSQLALKKGETIIEYEVTDPYTIGLVIRDGKVVKGFKVEKTRAELENLVRKFRSPFQQGQDAGEFSLNQAKELTDLLIGPALPLLAKGEHLIIVPDESLSLLPFEALLLDAPVRVLKEEATLLARAKSEGEGGTVDRKTIIRGLGKAATTRGGVSVSPRVRTQILFDTGSAQISKESKKQMEEILAALKSKELNGAQIRIEGHTDSIGNPGYNLRLSRRRAEAVFHYLKNGGADENLLSFTGKGDTEPVSDNATEQGRKQNRRVDFVRVMEKKEVKSAASITQGLVYTIDEYPISYYQSASVLSLQRGLHTSRMKGPTFFGLGDPVFDTQDQRSAGMRAVTIVAKKDTASTDITNSEGTKEAGYRFSRLENTAKEVKEVSSLFSDSRVLIGTDASKDNLKKEDLTTRRYVLFSTHGILGNEIPYIKQPALVLNLVGNKEEEGFLTATEIFNMSLNADLVGLSACQTGLGIQSAGEGVVGLSRAFMYAGTDSVLVSLWSVSDESTYKLMVKFFEGLRQGKDKLTALKEAKNYLRTSGYDNPFYWAPFILIGEAN